jgi:hypothetical protein
MSGRWLFFLDADGRLVGPVPPPFPVAARKVSAARGALCHEGSDLNAALPGSVRSRDRPRARPATRRPA